MIAIFTYRSVAFLLYSFDAVLKGVEASQYVITTLVEGYVVHILSAIFI